MAGFRLSGLPQYRGGRRIKKFGNPVGRRSSIGRNDIPPDRAPVRVRLFGNVVESQALYAKAKQLLHHMKTRMGYDRLLEYSKTIRDPVNNITFYLSSKFGRDEIWIDSGVEEDVVLKVNDVSWSGFRATILGQKETEDGEESHWGYFRSSDVDYEAWNMCHLWCWEPYNEDADEDDDVGGVFVTTNPGWFYFPVGGSAFGPYYAPGDVPFDDDGVFYWEDGQFNDRETPEGKIGNRATPGSWYRTDRFNNEPGDTETPALYPLQLHATENGLYGMNSYYTGGGSVNVMEGEYNDEGDYIIDREVDDFGNDTRLLQFRGGTITLDPQDPLKILAEDQVDFFSFAHFDDDALDEWIINNEFRIIGKAEAGLHTIKVGMEHVSQDIPNIRNGPHSAVVTIELLRSGLKFSKTVSMDELTRVTRLSRTSVADYPQWLLDHDCIETQWPFDNDGIDSGVFWNGAFLVSAVGEGFYYSDDLGIVTTPDDITGQAVSAVVPESDDEHIKPPTGFDEIRDPAVPR